RRAGDFNYNTRSSFVDAVPESLVEERRTDRLRILASSTPHRTPRERGRRDDWDEPSCERDPDAGMNQDLPRFAAGERVVHATFGSGAVVEVTGFGRDLKVTVDFDDVGRKKLLARYASLEKDWP